jgi:hypothetical protein
MIKLRILPNGNPAIFVFRGASYLKINTSTNWQGFSFDNFKDCKYLDLGFISLKLKRQGK